MGKDEKVKQKTSIGMEEDKEYQRQYV